MNPGVDSRPGFVEAGPGAGRVYNEAAFRYFLALELRRANRSARRLLLALVSLRKRNAQRANLPPQIAATVFSVLQDCVREVDFVGWHRDRVVAAALLTISDASIVKARHTVCARIVNVIDKKLGSQNSARLRVRVVELRHRPGM